MQEDMQVRKRTGTGDILKKLRKEEKRKASGTGALDRSLFVPEAVREEHPRGCDLKMGERWKVRKDKSESVRERKICARSLSNEHTNVERD
eukprot:2807649-Rhodomonas_salina.1